MLSVGRWDASTSHRPGLRIPASFSLPCSLWLSHSRALREKAWNESCASFPHFRSLKMGPISLPWFSGEGWDGGRPSHSLPSTHNILRSTPDYLPNNPGCSYTQHAGEIAQNRRITWYHSRTVQSDCLPKMYLLWKHRSTVWCIKWLDCRIAKAWMWRAR